MHTPAEQTVSAWMDTSNQDRERGPVDRDLTTDVCIVGAGIAGLSTAYHLAKEGVKVVVLDDGPIGGGQTQRTSAHLASALDDRYYELERIHGVETTRAAADSHSSAITRIETISREEEIDCEFQRVDGYLFNPPGQSSDNLQRELEAAHRAGLTGVELVGRAPWPSFDTGACLRFPRQGQFHPLKYLSGLAAAAERHGARIFTGTHASKIEGGKNAGLKTDRDSKVKAKSIVIATNPPINDLVAIHTKQAPYATYLIAARTPAQALPIGLYWDTLAAYHYVRLEAIDDQSDLLLVGGEDHKLGQKDDQEKRFERLEAWARERFPTLETVEHRWSGMVMETTDGLAFIGRNPMDHENVYIATGDSGMGLTHGTIAGMLLSDLIQGRENPWEEAYNPSRKPVAGRAWRDYLSENLNVAKQYVRDWIPGGEADSADAVPRGEGAIVQRGLRKIAVYCDDGGGIHEMSAVCPHLKCIVHWNGLEKCWDCPCHGSRFDCRGEVISGPANAGLERIEEPVEAR